MPKDKPIDSGAPERKDWKKRPYPFCVVKSEVRPNTWFSSDYKCANNTCRHKLSPDDFALLEEQVCPECGGDKFYFPDRPEDANQYLLVLEVLDGEKRGDWAWLWARTTFGKKGDGTPWGTRALLALSIDPDFNLDEGIEPDNSDLMFRPFMAMATPQEDPQYCKVSGFYPVPDDDLNLELYIKRAEALALAALGAVEVSDDSDEQADGDIPY